MTIIDSVVDLCSIVLDNNGKAFLSALSNEDFQCLAHENVTSGQLSVAGAANTITQATQILFTVLLSG